MPSANPFQEILQHWAECRSEPQRSQVWNYLTQARGTWYQACRESLRPENAHNPEIHSSIESLLSQEDSESVLGYCPPDYNIQLQTQTLRAWLRATDHACRHATPLNLDQINRIAKDEGASPGLLRDLCSLETNILRSIDVTALLVDTSQKGVTATLTIDLLENGTGEIFPAAALALCRDHAMIEAESNVARWAHERLGKHDVCWSLSRQDGNPISHLAGPSLSGALAVGLAMLLAPPEKLEDIAPARVGITAAIDAYGRITDINELWTKLTPETVQLAKLHTLVIAADQDGVPPRYQSADAEVTLIKVHDINKAVDELIEHALPRRALRRYERQRCEYLKFRLPGTQTRTDIHFPMIPLYRPITAAPLHKLDMAQLEPTTDPDGNPILPSGYAPMHLNELLAELQQPVRRLIVGDPGSGKSTLIQAIAWSLVSSGKGRMPARVRLRDWEQWETQHQETDIADFLAARLRVRIEQDAPTADHWRRWLTQGEVVLLLDGLEELSNPHRFNRQLSRLLKYKRTPIILTSRTAAFPAHRNHLDDFALLWLGSLSNEQRDRYIQVYPALNGFDRTALSTLISNDPALSTLARSPLLLAMICFIVDMNNNPTLPVRRVDLYDRLIDLLLTRPGHVTVHYPAEAPTLADRKAILADTALYLQLRGQFTFTDDELLIALTAALAENGYGVDSARPWANALYKEYIDNRGILDKYGGAPGEVETYAYTHLTLHEYSSAYVLTRRIHTNGWHSSLEFDTSQQTVKQLLDNKKHSATWTLTLNFLHELSQPPS